MPHPPLHACEPSPCTPAKALTTPAPLPTSAPATIHWTHEGVAKSAQWRCERGSPPPQRVVMVDDTTTADAAYRLACAGTALLWNGDFQNARQLLQALARRCDATPARKQRKAAQQHRPVASASEAFHQHRQAQGQRARILGMLLLPLGADYSLALRRAPNVQSACTQAWGAAPSAGDASVVSMRELLGVTSAQEWRRVGVEIAALGAAPHNRIHPHYGVFSPVRGEYIDLVAQAPLPPMATATGHAEAATAFDIGTGSGVLAAVLARRGVPHVVGTDQSPRALHCAQLNVQQLGVGHAVTLLQADLFPPGKAGLVVCNPPWLPARAGSSIEQAVYDEDSRMLKGFLAGLAAHLLPQGEGWLILSDLAEHLGLRTRAELLALFQAAGLTVLGRLDARPKHGKATNPNDPLHAARAAEVTSLWRLGTPVFTLC